MTIEIEEKDYHLLIHYAREYVRSFQGIHIDGMPHGYHEVVELLHKLDGQCPDCERRHPEGLAHLTWPDVNE